VYDIIKQMGDQEEHIATTPPNSTYPG
jgi:hypothetical protein